MRLLIGLLFAAALAAQTKTGSLDIQSNSLVIEVTNSGSPGTTVNKLAKVPAAVASVLTTSAADQISAVGVVIGGAGTTGSAQIGIIGQFSCLFDNTATTSGHFIVPSSVTAGTCSDAGLAYPATGEVMGQVLSTHGACGSPPCGPYTVLFNTPDITLPGAGGSNGNNGNGGGVGAKSRRTCSMLVGADNGTALVDADLGPQGQQCKVAFAGTALEIDVNADAGTPSVIVRKKHCATFAGGVCTSWTSTDLLSSALAAAASNFDACSNTGGTTGLDGGTTCSATLQNTSLAVGDWIELKSGTAGGTAKRVSIDVIYTVN